MLADDGEKFGGWPGTREWVYERGWLDRFMATIRGLIERGVVGSARCAGAGAVPSGGLAYLPTASYREMEAWSLPPDAALRLQRLERDLGEERMAGPDGALVRGAHWRNFLVKYPESNRMHKKMQALSALCRERGATRRRRGARSAGRNATTPTGMAYSAASICRISGKRCGAISPEAEAGFGQREAIACDVVDFDGDGHGSLGPLGRVLGRGESGARGAVEEFTVFASGINHADV